MPPLLDKYFWVLAVVVAGINAAVIAYRARGAGVEGPRAWRLGLASGLGLAAPFLVMGAGILVGGVSGTGAYLEPDASQAATACLLAAGLEELARSPEHIATRADQLTLLAARLREADIPFVEQVLVSVRQ